MSLRARYSDLPIRLKLLAPFAVLMLIWGGFGSFVLVRGQASETRARMASGLGDSFSGARAAVGDVERALIETVRLATHTRGIGSAVAAGDVEAVTRLLEPIALNANATLWVFDRDGRFLAKADPAVAGPAPASDHSAVLRAAAGESDERGDVWAEIGRDELIVAAPARVSGAPVGAIAARENLASLAARMARGTAAQVTLFSEAGTALATSGAAQIPYRPPGKGVLARIEAGGVPTEVLYGPMIVRGAQAGAVAISLPVSLAGTGAGRSVLWLAALVGFAVLAAVAIGMLTARAITSPLAHVVDAARALEGGDLAARSRTAGADEVGTLGRAFDEMAERLQESHAQLERKVAERTAELNHANAELARASSAKSDFLAMMSHELRTPLNAVIGFADMLRDPSFGRPSVGTTRELAGNIHASGQHLLTLINDVLDLAKVEAGKIDVNPEPVHIGEILSEVGAIVRPLAEAKRHELRPPLVRRLPVVMADPARLRQVLFNLLANAIKFTPEGGRIVIDVEPGDPVTLSVSDDGPGMNDDEASRIFEPFERGKSSSRIEGAGLGLSLARRLVELQGGTIWVNSTPGSGSTFSFTVPLAPARPAGARGTRPRSTRSRQAVGA